MVDVVHFKPNHAKVIQNLASTSHLRPWASDFHLAALAAQQHSYTVLDGNIPLACGGLIQHWQGRYEAWALMDLVDKKKFILVHRKVKDFFDSHPLPRVEAVVEKGFDAGHRWVKMLGFNLEIDTMINYGIGGTPFSLYSRVN